MPARCFVVGILSWPEKASVFSRMVVMCGWVFRNFLAFSFFIIQKDFLGNFSIAMFPIMSWGIFFIVRLKDKFI